MSYVQYRRVNTLGGSARTHSTRALASPHRQCIAVQVPTLRPTPRNLHLSVQMVHSRLSSTMSIDIILSCHQGHAPLNSSRNVPVPPSSLQPLSAKVRRVHSPYIQVRLGRSPYLHINTQLVAWPAIRIQDPFRRLPHTQEKPIMTLSPSAPQARGLMTDLLAFS